MERIGVWRNRDVVSATESLLFSGIQHHSSTLLHYEDTEKAYYHQLAINSDYAPDLGATSKLSGQITTACLHQIFPLDS